MLQTLFHIPREIHGYPVFGFGLLLAAWGLFSVILLARLIRRQGLNADTWSYLPLLALVAAAIVWILPAVSEAEGLPIRGYGVMLLLGLVAATSVLAWRMRRAGLDSELAVTVLFWIFVPGIVGARAFYVIEYWADFHKATAEQTFWAVLNVAQGGLVVYGSVIGGLVGVIAFARWNRFPLLALGDMVAPAFAVGLAFGRMGCMLNGCCFGGPCDLPWAVTFPWGSPAHVQQAEQGEVFLHGLKFAPGNGPPVITEVEPGSSAAQAGLAKGMRVDRINGRGVASAEEARLTLLGLRQPGMPIAVIAGPHGTPHRWTLSAPVPRSRPVHPAQIYSVVNAVLLFLVLWAFDPFRRRDGEVIALGLTLYPITRILLEIIRTDESPIFGTGLSISQNVSVLVLIGVVFLWIYVLRQPRRLALETDPPPER